MFRVTFLLIVVLLLITPLSKAEKKIITLLHTNDIESVYEPLEAAWRDDIDKIGGMAYLATLAKQVRKKESISILLDSGDIYTGALSKKSTGKLPFDLYSAMGYDVVNLGNHEFEYGWNSLLEVMPRARFPVLNANIVHKKSGELIAQPYTILEKEGVRIGVVGVMGVDAFLNATAVFQRAELTINDPIASAQFWVDKIIHEVNMIVVLTHQNKTAPMQTNKEADPSVQRGFDEDYAMAGKMKGVDVIIGGHSDHGLLKPVIHPKTGTVIGLTFGQGMHLGFMKFSVDTQKHDVTFLEGKLIPVDAGKLSRDERTHQLIEKERAIYPDLTQHIATINQAAMRQYNKESSLGNLITDAMRKAANSDIAMMNSGAIRADLNAGIITREHVMNVYPFVDKLTVIELTGKQVKTLVEYSLTLPYGIGQFSGLQMTYDSTKPEMQRLLSLRINGKAPVDNQLYSVATTDFVSNGGDGYKIFTQGTLLSAEKVMADVLLNEFKTIGNITLPPFDRIIDIRQ